MRESFPSQDTIVVSLICDNAVAKKNKNKIRKPARNVSIYVQIHRQQIPTAAEGRLTAGVTKKYYP